jgi:hypothetical protein
LTLTKLKFLRKLSSTDPKRYQLSKQSREIRSRLNAFLISSLEERRGAFKPVFDCHFFVHSYYLFILKEVDRGGERTRVLSISFIFSFSPLNRGATAAPKYIHIINNCLFSLAHSFKPRVARWFIFKPKIPIWEKFWKAFDWKMLIYLMAIWNILQTFGIFMIIWNILCSFGRFFSGFGIMYQEKSGNPV